ncbi:hypothetical protein CORC01_06891 [Colletotrichum orchidophilum]|uniref:Uncharacterized protein n=1 Tax=Colletotrichum orchidophilum TaxID=1209926 RepID=A0A1G4B944_9PEZI|nr:uncharacterized protein CORC01_06891 [Colletotrichum orchidophilum]OHE97856.1 hypothetical protein CORC01_06891 [Colletotrichum orchidophilum]
MIIPEDMASVWSERKGGHEERAGEVLGQPGGFDIYVGAEEAAKGLGREVLAGRIATDDEVLRRDGVSQEVVRSLPTPRPCRRGRRARR